MSKTQVTVFALMVAMILLALLPLRVVLSPNSLSTEGVSIGSLSGTVWKGKIDHLALGARRLGDIEYNINPASLLLGKISGSGTVSGGAVTAQGNIAFGLGPLLSISNAQAMVDLAPLTYRDPLNNPISGTLSVQIDSLTVTKSRCRKANFTVETDALVKVSERYNRPLPLLAGQGSCENDNLILALAGENAVIKITIDTQLQSSMDYTATINAVTNDSEIRNVLTLYGFVEAQNKFTLIERGNLSVGRQVQ